MSRQSFKNLKYRISDILPDDINYVRKTPHEHVLLRPGMYVGEIDPIEKETWVYNSNKKVMERKRLMVSSALIKVLYISLITNTTIIFNIVNRYLTRP
jgi:hypothetical protein